MARNIGMYYYKEYWKKCDEANHITDCKNEILYNAQLSKYIPEEIGNVSFSLTTTYPGLLIGSGYMHEGWKKDENALKLGFYFDYTSGRPCIPGSSIKGVINAAMGHWDYVKELCSEALQVKLNAVNNEAFRSRIFGNQKIRIPLYESVIFHEALAISVGQDGLLGDDYITPHKNIEGNTALDAFSNPNPIHFLKVMPRVAFRFDFYIPDEVTVDQISFSMSEIESIFRNIIIDFGLGAKTNVGYGYLDEDPEEVKNRKIQQRNDEEQEEKRIQQEAHEHKMEKLRLAEEERKRIEEERRIRNEEKKQQLIKESIEKGVLAYLDVTQPWKLASKSIDAYKKQFPISSRDIEQIKKYLDHNIDNELKGKQKRDWKNRGKKNWYKIESWVGKETAQIWFDQFIKKQ